MSEREFRTEIVQSGIWLYAGEVLTEVWIVKQNFEYWYEAEYDDAPEKLNDDGYNFFKWSLYERVKRSLKGCEALAQM